MAENNGWGRRDEAEPTREFGPVSDPAPQWGEPAGGQPEWGIPPQQQYQQPEPPRKSGAGAVLMVLIPLLIIAIVAAVLVWRWDDIFGSGTSDDAAPIPEISQNQVPETEAVPDEDEEDGADDTDDTDGEDGEDDGGDSGARPDSPDLPGNVEPVNAAARNNEPTGDFNSVYKSPPSGDNYTSDDFAEAVRDAFVEAYLDNGDTDQSLNVASPVTGESYQMNCTDEGSYVHCSGGNNANVYIA